MFQGYNVYGVYCATYEEACEVAGCDTPAQLMAEAHWDAVEEAIEEQDRLEARGPTFGRFRDFDTTDIPF